MWVIEYLMYICYVVSIQQSYIWRVSLLKNSDVRRKTTEVNKYDGTCNRQWN